MASKRPSLLTSSATAFVPVIVERSPVTAPSTPGAAAAAPIGVSTMQEDLMALLDQEFGGHKTKTIR